MKDEILTNPEVIGLIAGLVYMIFTWFGSCYDDRREK